MSRRVWIIAQKDKVEDSDIANASLNGCPEIANGIPPALKGIIPEKQLPYAYDEPLPVMETPLVRDLVAEIDQIKADIQVIRIKVGISDVLAE